jgi:hypothetical protein
MEHHRHGHIAPNATARNPSALKIKDAMHDEPSPEVAATLNDEGQSKEDGQTARGQSWPETPLLTSQVLSWQRLISGQIRFGQKVARMARNQEVSGHPRGQKWPETLKARLPLTPIL